MGKTAERMKGVSDEASKKQGVEASLCEVKEVNGVKYVTVGAPAMGGKSYLIESKGLYVLETGEGVLRSLAVTYVGSGGFRVYDGLPEETSYVDTPRVNVNDTRVQGVKGRRIFVMSPQVIGFWGLDAGFKNGLTIVADGGQRSTPVLVTVVWDKHRKGSSAAVEFSED